MRLKANQRALQMKTNNGWRYVFCIVKNRGNAIAFTDNRYNALPADYHLEYFRMHFADNEFRAN